jgi:hypothetical protein
MTAVLTTESAEDHHIAVPTELRAALEQHIRAAVDALTTLTDGQGRAGDAADQQRQRQLAALAATFPLESVITDVLAELRVEQAEAAAFAGASYAHLGDAAGVTRGRAQQMWPTAGKFGKRRKWLKKNQRRVRSALRALADRLVDLGPAAPEQDRAVIVNALAIDPATGDLTALDQALRTARTILDRPVPSGLPNVATLQQQIGVIAAAADADQPLPSDVIAPAVLEFPGLTTSAAATPTSPAWAGDFPQSLTSAITAVLALFGTRRVRPAPRVEIKHVRLEYLLGQLRAGTREDNADTVRNALAILLARPVGSTPDAEASLLDAVREMKTQAEVLLICPTCGHRPERDSHPEERAMHLDYLTYPWLDLVDGRVVQRLHCPNCQPSGYSGVDLNCPWCEEGFLLEAGLAVHRAALPDPVLRFLADKGWHTGEIPAEVATVGFHQRPVVPPVHASCLLSASTRR